MPSITIMGPRKRLTRLIKEYGNGEGMVFIETENVDEIVAVGPFGVIKGEDELRIVLNQLTSRKD